MKTVEQAAEEYADRRCESILNVSERFMWHDAYSMAFAAGAAWRIENASEGFLDFAKKEYPLGSNNFSEMEFVWRAATFAAEKKHQAIQKRLSEVASEEHERAEEMLKDLEFLLSGISHYYRKEEIRAKYFGEKL